jgi:hypothetical protein
VFERARWRVTRVLQPAADTTASVLERWVDAGNISFVMHIGDVSYAVGHSFIWYADMCACHHSHLAHRDTFHAIAEPVAKRLPWMVAAGNHEVCRVTMCVCVDML